MVKSTRASLMKSRNGLLRAVSVVVDERGSICAGMQRTVGAMASDNGLCLGGALPKGERVIGVRVGTS